MTCSVLTLASYQDGALGRAVVRSRAERLFLMEFKLQLVWSQLPNRKKRKLGKKRNRCSLGFIMNNSVNGSGLVNIYKDLNLHLQI